MTKNSVTTPTMKFSLEDIKAAVVFKFMAARSYSPLRSFFAEMNMRWGNCSTACAYRRANRPIIELGRKFYAKEIETADDGAEVVMHEIFHHIFGHLRASTDAVTAGYSRKVVNIAMDAIINAYLHSIGCATFMERFYKDSGVTAFLRPNSNAVFHEYEYDTKCVMQSFYNRLYKLEVTLEESLAFFHTYFAKEDDCQLLGSHSEAGKPQKSDSDDENESDTEDGDIVENDTDDEPRGDEGGEQVPENGNILSEDEAEDVLRSLGVLQPPASARNNFAKVISKVMASMKREGDVRVGNTISRRIPANFRDSDLINLERGRHVFKRPLRRKRDFAVFIDVSGSVSHYAPFLLGLIQALKMQDRPSRCFIWADSVEEISPAKLDDLSTRVGCGTNGEVVAAEIEKLNLSEVLILTDNELFPAPSTKIKARVHLCLVDGGKSEGGFADKAIAPDLLVHKLKLTGTASAMGARLVLSQNQQTL